MSAETYADYARRLRRTGLVPDPWLAGEPRFQTKPLVLSRLEHQEIATAAEQVCAAVDAAVRVVAANPELATDFLCLTPVQHMMFTASAPLWHGYARADVFRTRDDRWMVCEINADTPTGQPEAFVSGKLAAEDHPQLVDPNAKLEERFVSMVRSALAAQVAPEHRSDPIRAGIVYATEFTEDLSVIQLLQLWLEGAGMKVVLGSPWNVARDDRGRPTLLGEPCVLLLRHYKTDWWSERTPVWRDGEPYEDARPFAAQLEVLLRAQVERRAAVINPFGSVVAQNKRLFALMWERMDLLPDWAAQIVRRYVPETIRLDAMHPEQILAERERWVLKSDYGCEGQEVFIGQGCTDAEWAETLAQAIPERWVAQRLFEVREQPDGSAINYGPYLIAGRSSGLYVRAQEGPTDFGALSVPALVEPEESARE